MFAKGKYTLCDSNGGGGDDDNDKGEIVTITMVVEW